MEEKSKSPTKDKASATETKPLLEWSESIYSTKRPWVVYNDIPRINQVIEENVILTEGYIKSLANSNYKPQFRSRGTGNDIFIFGPPRGFNFQGIEKFTLFRYISLKEKGQKHVEVDFEIQNSANPESLVCRAVVARTSSHIRKYDRIQVVSPILAANFLVAKTDIDPVNALGVSTGVIFTEMDRSLKDKHPNAKIKFFGDKEKLSLEEEILKEEKKPIYVTNTRTLETSKKLDSIDIKSVYEEEFILEKKIKFFISESIRSFIYYPIYLRVASGNYLIGYGYNHMNSGEIPLSIIDEFQAIETEINQRIMDSYTQTIDDKQKIVELSDKGLKLEVTNREIIASLITKHIFSADIVFKMQVPIRLQMQMRYIFKLSDKYYVGAEIIGSTDDEKALDKYREIVKLKP